MSNGSTTWDYTYNADGLRTKRTNCTTTYSYVYNGSQLVQMTKGADTLYFTYDVNGTPLTVTYNGTTYYYVTNLQGDVVAILNSAGTAVATYSYEAWGGLLSSSGALDALNPLRYRGYVYDEGTGLYYLQSRYYNPGMGRFINTDAFVSTGQGILGNNMFAYCNNNPVNMVDYGGSSPELLVAAVECVALIACAIFAVDVIVSPQFLQDINEISAYVSTQITTGWERLTDFTESLVVPENAPVLGTVKRTALDTIRVHMVRKSPNLPSWKKLKVDMSHIKSGHMFGGSRNPKGNKSVFWGLTANEILRAIEEAYNNASKLHTQGDRILLKGFSSAYNLWIEMWINIRDLIIETAYPK